MVKNPPTKAGGAGDSGLIPGSKDPLEKETATHSSIWKIQWTDEPGSHSLYGVAKSRT